MTTRVPREAHMERSPSAPPWQPGVEPTPEQLAAWWRVAPDDVLLRDARRALIAGRAEHDCFIRNHGSYALRQVLAIDPEQHATKSRDYGRGFAEAIRLVREAADPERALHG